MEFSGNIIKMDKTISNIDGLVIKFTRILDEQGIDYVIISGYIAILFGRSRNTEDIDMFIEEMSYEKFVRMWNALKKENIVCIIEKDPKEAYEQYLKSNLALRFAVVGTRIPNFEVKFPKSKHNNYSINNKVEVILNGNKINTSELELQIAFKLYLGSEKDFEDAIHLYDVLKEHLDIELLKKQITELGVEKRAEEVLWEKG